MVLVEGFHPSGKSVNKDQKVFISLGGWHLGKVYLPVLLFFGWAGGEVEALVFPLGYYGNIYYRAL